MLVISSQVASQSFRVPDFVDFHNSQSLSWSAKLNPDFDYNDPKSLQIRCGNKKTSVDNPNTLSTGSFPVPSARLLATIPVSYDLRIKFPKCWSVGYIRDQGQCGSCWAVSTMASLSDRYCTSKSVGKVISQRQFSMQDVLECCTVCGFTSQYGCDGGYMSGAFNHARTVGISTGENYQNYTTCKPYFFSPTSTAATAPACAKTCNPQFTSQEYSSNLLKIKGYTNLVGSTVATTVSNAQSAIMTRGSIVASLDVYDDFFYYSSGVYQHVSGNYQGGHAVRVVGWGTTSVSGKSYKYWIVANSWGTSWGLKGFFWMIRGINNCNFEKGMLEGLLL